jgi:acetyl esterase/lipase
MSGDILQRPAPRADVRVPYGPDPLHFGDLRLPPGAGPHPVVVVIHGGFWRARFSLEHIGHACAALTSTGLATWNIEYRRIGNPGGAWPGTFLDVAAGVDHLREIAPRHNLDLSRVVVIGHSAGGHLALWLAGRSRIPAGGPLYIPSPLPVKAAISLAGVADLRRGWEMALSNGVVQDLIGGTPEEMPERYATASPIELLPLGVRQVLIRGTEDENVPFEISRAYHQSALSKGDDCELITLQGAGHFEVIDPRSQEWQQVARAVNDALA